MRCRPSTVTLAQGHGGQAPQRWLLRHLSVARIHGLLVEKYGSQEGVASLLQGTNCYHPGLYREFEEHRFLERRGRLPYVPRSELDGKISCCPDEKRNREGNWQKTSHPPIRVTNFPHPQVAAAYLAASFLYKINPQPFDWGFFVGLDPSASLRSAFRIIILYPLENLADKIIT